MKALLCYHSQSGNTALVSRFLSQKLASVSWDLFDIATSNPPDLRKYDLIGFATWTYYLALPPFFEQFLIDLPTQTGQTSLSAEHLWGHARPDVGKMDKVLTRKEFTVLVGSSFHTPESYPPYIVKGWAISRSPTPKS